MLGRSNVIPIFGDSKKRFAQDDQGKFPKRNTELASQPFPYHLQRPSALHPPQTPSKSTNSQRHLQPPTHQQEKLSPIHKRVEFRHTISLVDSWIRLFWHILAQELAQWFPTFHIFKLKLEQILRRDNVTNVLIVSNEPFT
tara:strand:+ start:725 stop:1147 length:423 start_codon:yes stop_codon:yes gene_type:complete